jgi:hypothetical protein
LSFFEAATLSAPEWDVMPLAFSVTTVCGGVGGFLGKDDLQLII